jgi:hypothetical protein
MTEELSRTRLYINTPLNKSNGSGIPLINLDWGSTNLPLKTVDEEVMKRTWAIHGNPGSCGSYTGGISKMTIEEVSRSILRFLNVRGEVFYGGAGASYWLGRIAERHSGSRLMLNETVNAPSLFTISIVIKKANDVQIIPKNNNQPISEASMSKTSVVSFP